MKFATLISSRNQALALISATFILTACGGGEDQRTADVPPIVVSPSATAGADTSSAVIPSVVTAVAPANPVVTPVVPVTATPVVPPRVTPAVVPSVTPPVVPVTLADSEPQIAGAPKTQAKANENYSFVPTAGDADGDKLTFSIANKPAWLTFVPATGALIGKPTEAQVGVYRNITIQVGAGGEYDTLPAFDIVVVSVGKKSVTLTWTPPTQNDDGSALRDLAGYKIRYGEKAGVYTTTISITNPGLATYMIDGLVPSTYYFVISAYNAAGIESNVSNEAAKTI